MLNDRARVILFWFTIGMVVLVAAVAIITILRACGGSVSMEPPLTISPAEVSLCPGEQSQFTVEDGVEATWDVTGGTISEGGLFTASDGPGDYTPGSRGGRARRRLHAYTHACPVSHPHPYPHPHRHADAGAHSSPAHRLPG